MRADGRAQGRRYGRQVLTAYVIWFAHFMLCWVAVEIWPDASRANLLAWAVTAVALFCMAMHALHLARSAARGDIADATRRQALGSIAIATVAVLFTALPSFILRP